MKCVTDDGSKFDGCGTMFEKDDEASLRVNSYQVHSTVYFVQIYINIYIPYKLCVLYFVIKSCIIKSCKERVYGRKPISEILNPDWLPQLQPA